MSIALWQEVQDLKAQVAKLSGGSVALADIAQLALDVKEIKERLTKIEKKANGHGKG